MKTLKEMDLKCEDVCPNICSSVELLRQEAINLIKELTNGTNISWTEKHPLYNFRHDVYPVADFIKLFFNITDEDLK